MVQWIPLNIIPLVRECVMTLSGKPVSRLFSNSSKNVTLFFYDNKQVILLIGMIFSRGAPDPPRFTQF